MLITIRDYGLPARLLSLGYLAAMLVELVLCVRLAHLRDPLPELPTVAGPSADAEVELLLRGLTARCARSGLEVTYESWFMAWLKDHLAITAMPPRDSVDGEVAPALLRSATGPGEYSATVSGDAPVLVPRVRG